MIKRVVVGADGTDGGRDAIALGAALAAATGAEVTLVGVHSTSLFPIPEMSDRRTLRRHAQHALRHDREKFAPGAAIHIAVDYSVPRGLRHYAQRTRADVVVVGSSAHAETGHVSIGRTGRQLLEGAPFAVAVAPHGLHEDRVSIRKIGIGLDSGEESLAALDLAADLAGAAGAELRVLSVVEDHVPALSSGWIASNRKHDLKELKATALTEAKAVITPLAVKSKVTAEIGDPGHALRALSGSVDLVIVGSRRWGPLARLVSGGVGETLVADAGCAVMIVPRPTRSARRARAAAPSTTSS